MQRYWGRVAIAARLGYHPVYLSQLLKTSSLPIFQRWYKVPGRPPRLMLYSEESLIQHWLLQQCVNFNASRRGEKRRSQEAKTQAKVG